MGAQIDLRPADHYVLPQALRAEFTGTFGALLQTDQVRAAIDPKRPLAAVGDVVSMTLHDLGISPKLFVCDYTTQRGGPDAHLEEVLGAWGDREVRVRNPAATITREAWDAIRAAYAAEGTTRIVVDGEEDMLGVPCFLEAPEGGQVVYGAPGKGLVLVDVDDAFRARVRDLVGRMQEP